MTTPIPANGRSVTPSGTRSPELVDRYTGALNNPPNVLLADIDPIWKNCGDKAILYDEHGIMIAARGYGDHCL